MSFDKSAIEKIQEAQSIFEAAKLTSGLDVPHIALPSDFELHSLEKYFESASRYRMTFVTSNLNEFSQYCADNQQEDSTCFIDKDEMKAKAIFDLGSPEKPLHKEHRAHLGLERTSAFKSLEILNGSKLNQRQLAEFFEDWEDHITTILTSDETQLTCGSAAGAVRKLDIETARELKSEVGDFSNSMTAMEKVEAKNKNRLPAYVSFSCTPFHGLSERDFKVRISLNVGGSEPTFNFRIIRIEQAYEDMALEFKDLLIDLMPNDFGIYLGITA